MVAGKVFENCYKFNPNRVKHASNHAKKYKYSSQKDHFHGKIIKLQGNKLAFFSCCPLPHLFS